MTSLLYCPAIVGNMKISDFTICLFISLNGIVHYRRSLTKKKPANSMNFWPRLVTLASLARPSKLRSLVSYRCIQCPWNHIYSRYTTYNSDIYLCTMELCDFLVFGPPPKQRLNLLTNLRRCLRLPNALFLNHRSMICLYKIDPMSCIDFNADIFSQLLARVLRTCQRKARSLPSSATVLLEVTSWNALLR